MHVLKYIKLENENEEYNRSQQPDQLAENSPRPPIGLQHSDKAFYYYHNRIISLKNPVIQLPY